MLHRGWLLLVVLSLPPVLGYTWRGFRLADWAWGIVGLIICSGFTYAMWHGLLAHTTNCNSGIHHRHEQPVRYWLTLALWCACYSMSVAAFFFEHHSSSGPVHR